MENLEQQDQQMRPGFEPGTSCLPILRVTTPPQIVFMLFHAVYNLFCAILYNRSKDTSVRKILGKVQLQHYLLNNF